MKAETRILYRPAGLKELEEFNRHIEGEIEAADAFRGEAFEMDLHPRTLLPTAWQARAREA